MRRSGLTSGGPAWLLAAVTMTGRWYLRGGLALLLLAGGAAAAVSTRDKAEQAIASVQANAKASKVAATPIANAKKALTRGADARKAGDNAHADQLDALGLEWAGVGVDLARAAELEDRAAKLEKEVADLDARSKRALSLIEQTVARRGRARERLKELGVDPDRTPEANTTPLSTSAVPSGAAPSGPAKAPAAATAPAAAPSPSAPTTPAAPKAPEAPKTGGQK